MILDDILYVALLLGCIAFGQVFRNLKDPVTRQWASTTIGFSVTAIVTGKFVIHPILFTLAHAALFALVPSRIRHLVAFTFSFAYLLGIFRLADWHGFSTPSTHTNLIIMMMTLKYAGLGFEVRTMLGEMKEDLKEQNKHTNSVDLAQYNVVKHVGFTEVIHYGFSYMGVLTGPYYRYRTYWDCINRNLGNHIDCWNLSLYKFKLTAVLSVLYLVSNYIFPGNYVLTEEFHERSFLYRAWYIYPAFISFRCRLYTGMILSECVCQIAGLGVYPSRAEPKPGRGPKDYKLAYRIMSEPEKLEKAALNFETVQSMNIWGVETCYSVRVAMKYWNITVQYWLATYVYKKFPNKALRAPAVFILSAAWHGYAIGYYFAILSVVLFLPIEDTFMAVYDRLSNDSIAKTMLWALLYYMRLTAMAYLSFAMQLLSWDSVIIYYNSCYWIGHILAVILYLLGRILKHYCLDKANIKEPITNTTG